MTPASRREIFAWALYDFGNSAFATTVLTVVFPLYFMNSLDGGKRFPYAVSLAMALSAVMAPVLGAICDHTATKKRALAAFWLIGGIAACALYFPTAWPSAFAVFVVALIGFEASNAIYNAFLPELAPGNRASRISSLGWALGYVGGGLHLLLALVLIRRPGATLTDTRLAIASAGAWWLLFSVPLFLWMKFLIVGEGETRDDVDTVSISSPLGIALVGKKVGDVAEFEAPRGKIRYRIDAFKY